MDVVGVSEGEVILEFSIVDFMLSELRFKEIGINVFFDNGEI